MCGHRRLHVPKRIADERRFRRGVMQLRHRTFQESGCGFSAITLVVWPMDAAEDRIDVSARLRQPDPHRFVYIVKIFDRENSTRDTGLVAANRHPAAGAIEARDRREAAVDRQPLGRTFDVVRGVLVDDSVPIEQYERHGMYVSKMPCNVEVNPEHGQKRRYRALRDRAAGFALKLLMRVLSSLSLAGTQRLGRLVGDLALLAGGRLAKTTVTNLNLCFPHLPIAEIDALARSSLRHTGCFAAESGMLWSGGDRWRELIVTVDGLEIIDDARDAGRGVLVLVPHFGNWEILNLFLGAHYGLTALYDRPRVPSFDAVVREGRTRTGSVLLPATAGGIRSLYAALKNGGVVALLPDQVPAATAGEYAPFFGRPALTMTLAHRLAAKLRPRLVLAHARRIPAAGGFSLGFEALPQLETRTNAIEYLATMNAAIERLVVTDPAQYQWEYKRFKGPKHSAEKVY